MDVHVQTSTLLSVKARNVVKYPRTWETESFEFPFGSPGPKVDTSEYYPVL